MTEIKGKVIEIFPTEEINEKFKKRVFVVETLDQYPQQIPMQFANDKTVLGDKLVIGGIVTAHINIKGKGYTNAAGEKKYFANLECWKIDIEQGSSAKSPSENDDDLPF